MFASVCLRTCAAVDFSAGVDCEVTTCSHAFSAASMIARRVLWLRAFCWRRRCVRVFGEEQRRLTAQSRGPSSPLLTKQPAFEPLQYTVRLPALRSRSNAQLSAKRWL